MPGGLLIGGKLVDVPNVFVIGPHDTEWSHLSPGDCRPRQRKRKDGSLIGPQQWILHKTIADDTEHVIIGKGPSGDAGGARATAEYWSKDPAHSGAHLITGHDGEVACLADLLLTEAYHATVSNAYSVGHETKELVGGGFYESAASATVATTLVGCRALGIQWQIPKLAYKGKPLTRMLNGGANCTGIFGHRDNTVDRGRWDPGDVLFAMLRARGVEAFDIEAGEDLDVWGKRQAELNRLGDYQLAVDGIPGAATVAALKAQGYVDGIWALGKAA